MTLPKDMWYLEDFCRQMKLTMHRLSHNGTQEPNECSCHCTICDAACHCLMDHTAGGIARAPRDRERNLAGQVPFVPSPYK